jgi:hypothetical protein
LCHEIRREVIEQRQPEQEQEKCRGAGDGKAELTLHQALEEFLAVNEIVVVLRVGLHGLLMMFAAV